MLIQLGVLMMFQFIGEVFVTLTGVPFPGPLCGMALLLGYGRMERTVFFGCGRFSRLRGEANPVRSAGGQYSSPESRAALAR
jgi:hypothetical protein